MAVRPPASRQASSGGGTKGTRRRRVFLPPRDDNPRTMNDDNLYFERINALSEEEERLYLQAGDGRGLSDAERARLHQIKVDLDRMYDLLHQREARRAAGQDPSAAELRPAEIVEHYDQ